MSPCIELHGVRCTLAGRTVLDIGRLVVGEGERVAIVGHNGAGKSTLLRVLSGFTRPSAGQVSVLGARLDTPLPPAQLRALRCEAGQVLQGLHLVPRLSALENALIGSLGRVTGWRTWVRRYPAHECERAQAALATVGMLDKASMRTDGLSGGERQKVAIARMLVQAPRLILADEPTAALDPSAAQEICRVLGTATAGATLVSVVHNTALLPLLADRVIGLRQGRVVFDLPQSQVDAAQLAALYGCPSASRPAKVAAHPDEHMKGQVALLDSALWERACPRIERTAAPLSRASPLPQDSR